MIDVDVRCQCCGLPVPLERREIARCAVCDLCDHLHGDALQIYVGRQVMAGQITPYHGLARMLVDDAMMAGELQLVPEVNLEARTWTLRPWILRPIDRWRVVVGRALAVDLAVDVSLLLSVILARHIPGRSDRGTLDAIARELREAFAVIDPNVVDVEVDCKRDVLDPEHLLINISTKTAAAPGMISLADPDIELPADIMSRPRGQA